MGAAFQIRKGEKEFLGPRRGAGLWPPGGGAKSPEGDGPYAYPAGGYFSMKKSNPRRRRRRGTEGRIWEKKVVN